MKSSSLLAAAVAAATFVFAACTSPETAATPAVAPAPASFDVTTVTRGSVARVVTLPAELAAWQEVTLHAKVAGHVRTLHFDRGDRVSAGDAVVDLDAPEIEADLRSARAELALAETTSGRVGRAHAKAPDLVVTQGVDEASARLEVSRASLARAQTLVGLLTIRAPFDGVVTRRFVDVGAFVPAATDSSSSRTAAVASISDLSKVRIRVAVPEREAAFVEPGTKAEVRIDSLGAPHFTAAVSRIEWALDSATRTMMAEVDLDNADGALRPGLFAHVRLEVQRHDDVLVLPSAAVLVEKNGRAVFVLDAEGRARKKVLPAGFDDGTKVEVLGGANQGERVLMLGGVPPVDGQLVQVKEAR